jgi:predicted metal-binding membrane protein
VLSGLGGIAAAAWIYLVVVARPRSTGMAQTGMSDHSMGHAVQSIMQMRGWPATESGLMLSMWAVMMVAMMLPTAVPMTLVYAAVARKAERDGHPIAPTSVFVAGYLAVWVVFSVAAAAGQRGLDQLALLSPAMASASPVLGSALLISAGVYELTPMKHACLAQCRAPAHFIAMSWRPGPTGAFRMGLGLGAYCLGCCWVLMGLLFLGGVMNLLWIAAIAAFILLEKTTPFGENGGRAVGIAMVFVGLLGLTGMIGLG